MKAFFRLVLLALVLLTVALVSALTAMRIAIHGREVVVPKLVGMTPQEAERASLATQLQLVVERQYYSQDIPEGRVMSQLPEPGTRVRRGWQVRVAQSLGPQRVAIPDVVGQSERAADLNIRRRGLDVGGVAEIAMPGAAADQVIAQSPPANASGVSAPKISLLVTTVAEPQAFVMPNFVGQSLGNVARTLQDSGMKLGAVTMAPQVPASGGPSATPNTGSGVQQGGAAVSPQIAPSSTIVSQTPGAGQKVFAGSTVSLVVKP
jgi:eukaryotic-like serine/threonine-protein kinase